MLEHEGSEIRVGARTAIRTCMGVQPDDRLVIISDEPTVAIGQTLAEEAKAITPETHLILLERYGDRPITETPVALLTELRSWQPTVTLYAASSQPGEIGFRIMLRRYLLNELHVRHGHMPGITPRLMSEGMAADYHLIERITRRIWERVRSAHRIHVTSPAGTDLTAEFSPARRWVPCTGIYHRQGEWGNLPEGETFTAPLTANGTLVVNVLGDYFSQKYGVLDTPVTIRVEDGRAVEVSCANPDIAIELFEYLRSAKNGTRMGEFAIGTNVALKELTGNLLQDEKMPGVHVAFGNPYPEDTGADWSSQVHVDVIPIRCTIEVDGEVIMRDGEFMPKYLEEDDA
ncbi:MAG: aminopeptidase [Anaerolineae bacterium]|nr:aminopeptidase [Anaerolineae bacterium]